MGRDAWTWNLSPSALNGHDLCERADYLSAVLGQKEPERPYQRDGKRWHEQVERYVLTGELPAEKPPLALLTYLPTPPVPRDCVEFNVRGRAPGATGVIDLIDVIPPTGVDGRGLGAGLTRLTDHKFRASLKLEDDSLVHGVTDEMRERFKRLVQPLHYTTTYFRHLPPQWSAFRWLVVDKKTCRVAEVHVFYAPGEAAALFNQRWRRTLLRIRFTRRLPTLREVPPTGAFAPDLTKTCARYGGCFFRPLCAQAGIDVYRDKWSRT